MRPITVKYAGECRKCLAPLPVGSEAIYERRVGMWCPACAPTDTEEIRSVRQDASDRKADKYEGWAGKRYEKIEKVLAATDVYAHDWQLLTQPGRVPFRDRIYAQRDKAMASITTAEKFEEKAAHLRKPPAVKGDADAKRQELREWVRARLVVGMVVDTAFFGTGTVRKINQKTASIENCGTSGTFMTTVDLSFIIPPRGAEPIIPSKPISAKPPRPTRQERIDAAKALCIGKDQSEIPAEVWATAHGYLAGPARELVISEHWQRYNC